MCDIDPDCSVAVLYLYMGMIKVVPLTFGEGGGELAAFNVKYGDSTLACMHTVHPHCAWCGVCGLTRHVAIVTIAVQ